MLVAMLDSTGTSWVHSLLKETGINNTVRESLVQNVLCKHHWDETTGQFTAPPNWKELNSDIQEARQKVVCTFLASTHSYLCSQDAAIKSGQFLHDKGWAELDPVLCLFIV